MATAQWPARALGMLSSRVSINTVSQHMVSTITLRKVNTGIAYVTHMFIIINKNCDKPRFRQARVFVHFHSFSCVATLTSSITKGTHPPKTYILQREIETTVRSSRHSFFNKEFKQWLKPKITALMGECSSRLTCLWWWLPSEDFVVVVLCRLLMVCSMSGYLEIVASSLTLYTTAMYS